MRLRDRVDDRQTVLVVTAGASFATMFGRVVISPVAGEITATFAVSTGAFGAVMTGTWAAYAFSQYPSGVLAAALVGTVLLVIGTTAIGHPSGSKLPHPTRSRLCRSLR